LYGANVFVAGRKLVPVVRLAADRLIHLLFLRSQAQYYAQNYE